jgi:hypothetical protein
VHHDQDACPSGRRSAVWKKRIKDIIAMLLIGDRAMTLIAARNRALVWRFGPGGLHRSATWQTDHPRFMRLEGAVSIGLGVLLAQRQYRERRVPRASAAVDTDSMELVI